MAPFRMEASPRIVHHDTRVINFGDRLFYRVTQAFALIVILLALLLVLDLFRGAWEAIQAFGLKFLVGTTWDPVNREFSTLPTIIGTLVKAFIAILLAVPISIGSAVFITFIYRNGFAPSFRIRSNYSLAFPVSCSACGLCSLWCQ